ncbi:hypothetical protein ABFS83_12G040800 [Erythranthe nasuta]
MSKIGLENILFELNLGVESRPLRRYSAMHQLTEMDVAVVYSPENVVWLAHEAISVKKGAMLVVGEFRNFLKLAFQIFLVRDGLCLGRKVVDADDNFFFSFSFSLFFSFFFSFF